ncbi:MAG: DUF2793 domain-containing protein [Pseudomonadota bacterium]
MANSDNLAMPYLEAAQAQKHVTHNEALRILDAVVQLSVKDKDLTTPPGSPVAGDRYIVAASATGAWAGQDNKIAAYQDGGWLFYTAQEGWRLWVADEGKQYIWDGTAWMGALALSPNQAFTNLDILEEEVSVTGTFTETTIQIPNRGIVFCVSTRTTEAITGASSYDCGDGAVVNRYGGSLGIAINSSNAGVIGPTAYYADTVIRLTANGGNFTGGKVRVAIHYMTCQVPQS